MTDALPKHPKQSEIVVYSKDYCPYCSAAMNLLTQKGVGFDVIDVGVDLDAYKKMIELVAPRRTVPQIFIANKPVGGFDDLKAMDDRGELETAIFPEGRS